MPEKSIKKIELFTQLTTQILILSTGGIAAGVAFLQISGVKGWAVGLMIGGFVCFIAALATGVFGLMVVIGQIDEATPDFNQCMVRMPNLFAILFFGSGICLFLTAAIVHFFSADISAKTEKNTPPASVNSTFPAVDKFSERLKGLNVAQLAKLEAFMDSGFKECPSTDSKAAAVPFTEKNVAKGNALAKNPSPSTDPVRIKSQKNIDGM